MDQLKCKMPLLEKRECDDAPVLEPGEIREEKDKRRQERWKIRWAVPRTQWPVIIPGGSVHPRAPSAASPLPILR